LVQHKLRALCTLFAVASVSSAAATEPFVFVVSHHNLDFAKVACDRVLQFEPGAQKTLKYDRQFGFDVDDITKHILEAVTECKSVRNPQELGRRIENELIDALAVNTRCGGVTVMREPHPDYDRGSDTAEVSKVRQKSSHWDLHIDYNPGSKIYGWTLFPNEPGPKAGGPFVGGEGETAKNADQICIVVQGGGHDSKILQ
jgi:hypothetical protein